MHSEMLHMLLYKKDLGRPIKKVLSFYNLRRWRGGGGGGGGYLF